jgi:hypothetical protein
MSSGAKVEKGLRMIERVIDRECHLKKAFMARLNVLEEKPRVGLTKLLVDALLCPSVCNWFDSSSPTMDILRPYLKAVQAGREFSLNCRNWKFRGRGC